MPAIRNTTSAGLSPNCASGRTIRPGGRRRWNLRRSKPATKFTGSFRQGSGAGRVVSVNFHGLPDSARGADWRASFVVVSDTGAVRYSSLWNAGTNSVTLAANENTLYLSVAGTPATQFLRRVH